jgi:hypothetical protein
MDARNRRVAASIVAAFGIAMLALGVPAHGQVTLTQGNPVTVSVDPTNYTMTIETGFWNVVGVSALATSDWDITHGTTSSALVSPWADYVIGNDFTGPLVGNSGSVSRWSGADNVVLVHADHGLGIIPTATSRTYAWQATDILYFWEVNIATAGNYDISVTAPGSTNLNYRLFAPQAAGTWISASGSLVSGVEGTPTLNQALSVGWHCLVVERSGGPGTTATVTATVTPVGGATTFAAQSVSVVGAPVTVSPGGTFVVTRSIQNTGAVAGACNYSIRLSTNTIISTADTQVYSGTTASIAPSATNTFSPTCTVPGGMAAGTYYVGLYIAGPPISTANTVNPDVTVTAAPAPPPEPAESALGCAGTAAVGKTGGGKGFASLIPLALLAALCLWIRRRPRVRTGLRE